MNWDEDELEYGYVITRSPGAWWHMHFCRANLLYDCQLLGRPIDIFANIQQFSPGARAESPPFLLTLDGEGVPDSANQIQFDGSWGIKTGDSELIEAARHFQHEVMPLLHNSDRFNSAVREIVYRSQYLSVVDSNRLRMV